MNPELLNSFLVATSGLFVLLIVAVALGVSGQVCSAHRAPRVRRLLALTLLVQAMHLAEEAIGGMHMLGPVLLGLAPWPLWLFLGFNLACISAWLLSLTALERSSLALIAAWFLALASVANAVAHPALAIFTSGYFPGLVTAPVLGVLGYLLLRALGSATRGGAVARAAAPGDDKA